MSEHENNEALRRAARALREQAALRFDEHGPHDARGAALWDAGCYIDPDDNSGIQIDSSGADTRDASAKSPGSGGEPSSRPDESHPPHEDWCCAKGCAGYGFCAGCEGAEADCRCFVREVRHYAVKAWDEGYRMGQDAYAGLLDEPPVNPYREETR